MRTLAALLLICSAAFAAPLRVRVFATDEDGAEIAVPRARLLVRPMTEVVWPERDLPASVLLTDRDGSLLVNRADGPVLVVAGLALRGTAWARVAPGQVEVRLVLRPEAILSGTVAGPDGMPVPGAEVLTCPERPEDTGDFLSPGNVCFREVADGEGRFVIYRLRPDSRYRVRASSPGYAPATLRDRAPGETPVALVLKEGATVRGLVIGSPGGAPVPGAEVELGSVRTLTGDDGRFELRGIPPGVGRIAVTAAGHRQTEDEDLSLGDGDVRVGILVRVLGVARLTGRVLGPATAPVADAEIFLRYPPDPQLVPRLPPDRVVAAGRSDAEGRFDLRELLPAQGVDVIVRHPAHAPTVYLGFSLTPTSTVNTVILLRAGGLITGRVVNGDGEGIGGAEIYAVDDREDLSGVGAGEAPAGPTIATTVTDEAGEFRLEHVAVGRRALVALPTGRRPVVLRGVGVADRSSREGLVLVAAEGAAISGRVIGPEGAPVPGAAVAIRPAVGPWIEGLADGGGAFRFDGLAPGLFTLRASADGYPPWLADGIGAPSPEILVRLELPSAISGRVLREGSSDPLPGAVVRALIREGPDELSPERAVYRLVGEQRAESPGGTFSFAGLPPGGYRFEAFSEEGGFGFRDGIRLVSGEETVRVDLELFPGQTVRGRVLSGEDGQPVEGATVAIRGTVVAPGPLIATASADGTFLLRGVPPGFHSLLVTARDFAPVLLESVEVRPAADSFLPDVILPGGAVLRGEVAGPDGEPRLDVTVRITSPEFGGSRTARTEADGTFLFEHVGAGSWLVDVEESSPGAQGRRRQRLVVVRNGEEIFLSFGSGDGSTVTGRVTAGGEPLAFTAIRMLRLDAGMARERQVLSTVTDAEGNYVFSDVREGDLLLLVTLPGRSGAPARSHLRLRPGPVTIHDLILPDSGIEGTVENLDTGEPLEGVRLLLTLRAPGSEGTFLEQLTADLGETESLADGTFRFPAVLPGFYRVSAWRAGFGQTTVEDIRVLPGGDTPVRVAMPPAGFLSGRVEDDSGRPVTHARVFLFDAAGRRATRVAFLEVDFLGRFQIDSLRTGVYAAEFVATGYGRTRVEGVEVFPGGTPEVLAVLKPEGRLLLTVYGAGGHPLKGARVSVRDFWGRAVRLPEPPVGILTPWKDPALTGDGGTAVFANLPPGVYEVSAEYPGLVGEPVRVRVLDGEGSRSVIVLLPPTREIR